MSTTGQLETFSDLYSDLQNRAREATGVTATENQAKRYINIALHDMHLGTREKFPWAERRSTVLTQPTYNTGTMSLSRGGTTATGTSTEWNTSNEYSVGNTRVGGKFTVNGGMDVYEATAVGSDTSITFTPQFIGADRSGTITAFASGANTTVTSTAHGLPNGSTVTISGTTSYNGVDTVSGVTTNTFEITTAFVENDATGTWKTGSIASASYLYFEDTYALASDFLRPVDAQKFDEGRSIDLISRTEFRRRYPRNAVPGRPRAASIIELPFEAGQGVDPRKRIVFSAPPDSAELIPYAYITNQLAVDSTGTPQTQLSADADEPIVPLQYRHAILLHALWHWYRDKKDDARAKEVGAEYTSSMSRIVSDNEIGGVRAQFRPRITNYRSAAKRPWRGGGGRYDTNGRFDRMER